MAGTCLGVCAVLLSGPLSLAWQVFGAFAAGIVSLSIELTRQGLDGAST